ncbi:MAG: hypothetical protein ABWY34_09845 [Pseudoxanthomonas sp.]
MAGNFYKSWWQEMGAISRGMTFIEGNLATPSSVDSAATAARQPGATAERSAPAPGGFRKQARRAYRNFLLLGGRPVTPGHNDDIDEPFPQIEDDEPAPQRRFVMPRRVKTTQQQTCATC